MNTGADDELMVRYLEGAASNDEVAALEARLRFDPDARRALVRMSHLHALCAELAREPLLKATPRRRWRWPLRIAAIAASILAVVGGWRLAMPTPEPAPMVTSVHGTVLRERTSTRTEMALWQRVAAHDRLVLGADAELDLAWPDGTTVVIGGGGTVTMAEPAGATLKLEHGWLHVVVASRRHHDGVPFAIATPEGIATDTGTEFDVRQGAEGTTIAVDSGAVEFAGSGSRLAIAAGRRAVAAPGRPAQLIAVESVPAPSTASPTAVLPIKPDTHATPNAAPQPDLPVPPERLTLTGTVTMIDAAKNSFTLLDDANGTTDEYRAYFASGEVRAILARIAKLKVGERLTVTYTEREGRRVLAIEKAAARSGTDK